MVVRTLFKIAFILLLAACQKKEGFENIKIIGHGGNGMEISSSIFHDNSLEAIELAMNTTGCDGIEIDVRISKDSVLWLYHDEKLEDQTNLEGTVGNLTSEELSEGHYKGFHHEKLVRLDEVDFSQWEGKTIFLDLKPSVAGDAMQATPELFVDLFDEITSWNDCSIRCILPSLSWAAEVPISYYIYYITYIPSKDQFSEYVNFNGYQGFMIGYIMRNNEISSDQIQQIKNQNRQIFTFDMRSPKGIRSAMKKKPTGVLTDDIKSTIIEKY